MIESFYIFMSFVFGACFGSFANVVIYRWPRDESFVRPRSKCPQCSKLIPFYYNIPILSWLFLKGRCAFCKNPISIKYPLIEALVGILFVLIYLTSGFTLTSLNMMIFTILAVPCFFIDLEHMYLPDVMTLPGLTIALVISFFNTNPNYMEACIGALMGGGLLWFLAFAYKKIRGIDGLGGGDIKLLAWLGALLGYQSVTFIMLLSSISGTIFGAYYLIFKDKDAKTFAIPFGPFLIIAAYLYYFVSYHLSALV